LGFWDERDADYADCTDCTDYADFEICWIVPCKILTPLAPKISHGRFRLMGEGGLRPLRCEIGFGCETGKRKEIRSKIMLCGLSVCF
jgi:hypothetical protein